MDIVLDGGRVEGGVPSTVVRMGETGMVMLREGALGRDDLAAVAGVEFEGRCA